MAVIVVMQFLRGMLMLVLLVSMLVRMLMGMRMDVLMLMRMNQITVSVFMSMSMHVFVRMTRRVFVLIFHISSRTDGNADGRSCCGTCSQCVLLPRLRPRHNCLSKRNSSIVGRNALMHIDSVPTLVKNMGGAVHQVTVLEDAAA